MFKYQVMSFKLFNTLVFQEYINKILVIKLDIFIIIYLVDILNYIKNPKKISVYAIYLVLD